VKTRHDDGRAKTRRRKTRAAKRPTRAHFIGTRPVTFSMTLREQVVEVEVRPAIGTTTHVNLLITISRGGEVLDWELTRAELASIGRTVGMLTEPETSQ
jgi:hypothetical protein